MSDAWSQGALYLGDGRCRFRVWTPDAQKVEVHVTCSHDRVYTMEPTQRGYHETIVDGVEPGCRYLYRVDNGDARPDPASRHQPDGVHAPSAVIDRHFDWDDAHWFGIPLSRYIIYELHVGTFTPEGTFEAIIPRLNALRELGITAIELMPVAQFPGMRNWGYDGAYPYATQNSYGGPDGLRKLVNAAHNAGIAVILDVVYNHLGPEGNYLSCFGPYFTDDYRTPWGRAINYDGPWSDEVRNYFIGNALHWFEDFHIDTLRLDAVHSIIDVSAYPFLRELAERTEQLSARLNRRLYLIAENDRNDIGFVQPVELRGYGLDAQWNDDFHHSLHTLLTGESRGYLKDFGRLSHLARVYRNGYAYSGEYSLHRRRRHGSSACNVAGSKFVVCSQNHDQIGNRMLGERLSQLVGLERLKLAAGATVLSPFIPLLFMGEEYGETNPFRYFVSHGDEALVAAVRKGRRDEFPDFQDDGEAPDPQDEETFNGSKLGWERRLHGRHAALLDFYRELIRLRTALPPFEHLQRDQDDVFEVEANQILLLVRRYNEDSTALFMNFSSHSVIAELPLPEGTWIRLIDSADTRWLGAGSTVPDKIVSGGEVRCNLPPHSFIALSRERHDI